MNNRQKLQKLRKEWKTASAIDKRIIEIRAKLLKKAVDKELSITEERVRQTML